MIERALAGDIQTIKTPPLHVTESMGKHKPVSRKAAVTEERLLEVSDFRRGKYFDLETPVGKHILALHIHYPGRVLPEWPELSDVGVLSVDISSLERRYRKSRGSKTPFISLLRSIMGSDGDIAGNLTWLHHPRKQLVLEKLREELLGVYDPTTDQRIPPPLTSKNSATNRIVNSAPNPPESDQKLDGYVQNRGREGYFKCLRCRREWRGCEFVDAHCIICGHHLFSRFVAEVASVT